MNDFVAKKLAEVEAFCKTSALILEKAGINFAQKFSETASILSELSAKTVVSALPSQQKAVFDEKLARTQAKLGKMMELYIGDEWDNPVEVLEWSSFFTGAAAAHCALASALQQDLNTQLSDMSKRYEDALHQVIQDLRSVGAERRQS